MSDCEWMFADVATGLLGINALAHLNPLRWSGPVSFDKAIADLQDVLQDASRPVLVKVPANTLASKEFATTQEAIDYLKSVDPAKVAEEEAARTAAEAARCAEEAAKRAAEAEAAAAEAAAEEAAAEAAAKALAERAERISKLRAAAEAARTLATKRGEDAKMKAEEVEEATRCAEATKEAAAAARAKRDETAAAVVTADAAFGTTKSELAVEWMFGDAGKGLLGYTVAHMNPLRWSGSVNLDAAIEQMNELKSKEAAAERPIVVRMPPGKAGSETTVGNAAAAATFLHEQCPLKAAAKQAVQDAKDAAQAAEAKLVEEEAKVAAEEENCKKATARSTAAAQEFAEATKRAEAAEAACTEAAES